MLLPSLLLAAVVLPGPPRDRDHVQPCPSKEGTWQRVGGAAPTGAGGFDLSPDGRFVAFASDAALAGRADADGRNVWLLDRVSGALEPISIDAAGRPAGRASEPSLSADGRFVAFTGFAPLDASDDGPYGDVFVRDRLLGTTHRLSALPDGAAPSGTSRHPVLSDDGSLCAFESWADDLSAGDGDAICDVFVGSLDGAPPRLLSGDDDGACHDPVLSGDGRVLAFVSDPAPDDEDGARALVIVDLTDGTRERLPLGGPGPEGPFPGLSLSHDGSRLAFASRSPRLLPGLPADGKERVFLYERDSRTLSLQSVGPRGRPADEPCFHPSLSDDGRTLAFQSRAGNLVDGTSDGFDQVYLRDLARGVTQRVTRPAGDPSCGSGGDSVDPVLAGNGTTLLLASDSSLLVEGDTNGVTDLFVFGS